jgi:hypothetical protein
VALVLLGQHPLDVGEREHVRDDLIERGFSSRATAILQ